MSATSKDGICPRCNSNNWVLNYLKGYYQTVCVKCGFEEVQTEQEWEESTML